MKPLTQKEFGELKNMRTSLYLLAQEPDISQSVRDHLYAMSVVLRDICVDRGGILMSDDRAYKDKKGVVHEVPDGNFERWQANK